MLEALVLVVAAERPALEARLQEAPGDVLVRLLGDPLALREDPVLEHRRAGFLHRDHVQVVERPELARIRVLHLEHLRELVVGHRRGRVDVAVQEQRHVERLVHDRDVVRVLRVDAVLDERRVELVLVPAAPDADLLAAHVCDRLDPAVGARHLGHAALVEDLRDVDEVAALVAGCEQRRQPVDPELGLAARHDLLGGDVRPTGLQCDVESLLLVIPFLERCVVARELRLRHPLQLERHLVELLGLRGGGCGCGGVSPRVGALLVVATAACEHEQRGREERGD